jgi:hypothetical protein
MRNENREHQNKAFNDLLDGIAAEVEVEREERTDCRSPEPIWTTREDRLREKIKGYLICFAIIIALVVMAGAIESLSGPHTDDDRAVYDYR